MPDLPTNPTPTPPPAPPTPIVLGYHRAEKAKRVAAGGIMLMGIALTAVAAFVVFAAIFLSMRGHDLLRPLIYMSPPALWGTAYIVMALLMSRGVRWAAWITLVMSSTLAVGWVSLGLWATVIMLIDRTPWLSILAGVGSLAAVGAGFVAMVVEVYRALREPRVWRLP